jgi:hypothetical protein
MELELNEHQFPGFAAEASLEKPAVHYGWTNQSDTPQGVSPAAFCWDPWRQKWVLC